MERFFLDLIDSLVFLFGRLNWWGVIDLILVALIFFGILQALRESQAMVLLRGVLLLVALVSLLGSLDLLPAFSWLVQTTLPALLLAIPVIFAPEIRRALERLGRAGVVEFNRTPITQTQNVLSTVVSAAVRLSDRRHGALIVLKRGDNLDEYIRTGVPLDAFVTAELLLQVFYPNTPLHDGAVIISGSRLVAASCVMPLSASGVLTRSPERQMGLRHRAALGISEVSDAVGVIVSEETGSLSVVQGGRMIRRLDAERLENILRAFFQTPTPSKGVRAWFQRLLSSLRSSTPEVHQ